VPGVLKIYETKYRVPRMHGTKAGPDESPRVGGAGTTARTSPRSPETFAIARVARMNPRLPVVGEMP
jgi:hypothetical protein